MPRGPLPVYAVRDCRFDHVITAAIKAGAGKPVYYRGIETEDRAADIRRGAYRCGQHRKVSVRVSWLHQGEEVSKSEWWPPDKERDGTYALTIRVWAKSAGRKHHVEVHGPDRSVWPYNPFQKKVS